MRTRTILLALALLMAVVPQRFATAQEAPGETPKEVETPAAAPADPQAAAPGAPEGGATEAGSAAEPAPGAAAVEGEEKTGPRVIKAGQAEEVRVLRPQDMATEIVRLKSKADIKAEISLITTEGRPILFKGVIRNGKLIERIVEKRFEVERDLDHPHCGVRLWWSGGSDGYIFFRYSAIKTISITGTLSDAERAEIFRRLKAKREGKPLPEEEKQAAPVADVEPSLEKMSLSELEAHLMQRFSLEQGWDQKRFRDLKRRQLIENQLLNRDEAVFVQYFNVLAQVRFRELKRTSGAITITPGKPGAEPTPAAGNPTQVEPPAPPVEPSPDDTTADEPEEDLPSDGE